MIHPNRKTRRITRLLGAASVAAVAVGLLPVSPASAAVADICPAAGQTDRFTDDAGSVHEANINCAAAYNLVTGTTATTYNPTGNLTRGQAATILVNYVETSTGTTLTTDATADFTDTAGNVHATNIEKAADNNIVRGFPGGTFRPDQLITRAQFASMAVQATERVLGSALPVNATNAFDDDNGNVHESNIEKAADNGILEGTGPRTFSPNANVTRGQTATIVIRAAGNVLFPAGRFAPRTGAAQAFAVTPTEAVTQTVDTGRQFSVTVPAGAGALRIQLFACANIRATDTTFAGTSPGLANNNALPGTVNSTITVLNGNPVTTPANFLELAATTTGTVTFTVSGAAGQCVIPVVYRDVNNDDQLNLGTNNRPTEPFGIGGRTTFAAPQAQTGTALASTGVVELHDAAANLFQQAGASFIYGRAGDIFQLSIGGTCTASTIEVFEQRLSTGDAVTGTYNRAGGSLFCLIDQAPVPPAITATGTGRTVTFNDSPTPTVASYNVYRAAGIPGIAGGAAASCPNTGTNAAAYTSIGTVADTSLTAGSTGSYTFTDTTATAGSLQCYAVSAVDRTGDEGPLSATGDPRTVPAADVAPPAFQSATAAAGTNTVTVTYNEAIRCNTVALNGSDYAVSTTPTAGGFPTVNASTAAVCVTPVSGASMQVSITVTNALAANQRVLVTAQAGTDGNTVLDLSGNAQAVGNGVLTETGGGTITPPATATNPLESAVATAGTNNMTVTYTELVLCSTVQPTDFTVTNTQGPNAVVCGDGTQTTSDVLVLSFPGTPFTAGTTGTVTANAGLVNNANNVPQTASTIGYTTPAA